jgi:hypothetical protein
MYPEILDNYALVRHHWTASEGDDHAYVLYGLHNPGALSAAVIAGNMAAMADTTFLTVQSEDCTHADVHVVANIGGVLSEANQADGTVGGSSAPPVSPQVSCLIQKQTVTIGRAGRGRIFLPYLAGSYLDATNKGIISSADLPTVQTMADDVLATITGDGYTMVLLHRDASTPTPVTSLNVEQQVATQRRRNRKAAHRR